MAQLHFYVPDEVAERLREKAQREGLPLSQYLARLAKQEGQSGWPAGYFEDVLGKWEGDLERPEALQAEERDNW